MAGEILSRLILIILLILVQTPVTYLVVKYLIYEDGPSDGFRKLRSLAGIREWKEVDADGYVTRKREIVKSRWASRVLYCYNCLSPYVCLVVAIISAFVASYVTEINVGTTVANISQGYGTVILGLVTWLPVTGMTIITFDTIGTP